MDLTKTERLILINQYRMLSVICPDEKKDSDIAIDILANGYKHNYDSLVDFLSDDMPEEISKEVIDILQMFRSLNNSYHELNDKSGIDKGNVIFQGFDGNEETEHYSYADFFINKYDRYSEFSKVAINSHCNMLYMYRPMLKAWSKYERYQSLNKEQIIEIINAYK